MTQNSITDWLLTQGWQIEDQADFTAQLALAYREASIPVERVRLTIRLLHPQVMGFGYTWEINDPVVVQFEAGHDMRESDQYKNSPFAALFEDEAAAIRRPLYDPKCPIDYPILKDLLAENFTDYVALPLVFSDGRRSAITFSSRAATGFSTEELTIIYDSLPALSRIIENFALKRTAAVLLETYLGHQSGQQVLNGKVKRGDGQRIRSIIWFSDLRQSTLLAEHLEDTDFLDLLNKYFECSAGAVLEHGGEVLRYIGDAVLAIFPLGETDSCKQSQIAAHNAEAAARLSFLRIKKLNNRQREMKKTEIDCGIGLHVGEVMYGNIGTPERLEFSVIGTSANEAARLENMTKDLNVPLIVSEQFQNLHGGKWRSLGMHELKGFRRPRELFTFAD